MGALVIRVACAWLLLLQLAGASHVVYDHKEFEASAVAAKMPPSIVDPLLRTGYHFQPPKNWINDPNAPMYYKGWYHFFYQYNPNGAVWGNIVWAHSVSRDLINWVSLETAIEPSIPSDQHGCWSGSATILRDGTPVIMYTGVDHRNINYQVQNIAFPKNKSGDPLLREWVKPGNNPIIVPEPDINATQFRDPTTAWLSGGQWRLLIGSAAEGGSRGVAYVYRSRDFRRWYRVGRPLHSAATGMWECPDFYPVEAGYADGLETTSASRTKKVKYVLKNSLDLRRYDYYTVGTYDEIAERYVPDDAAGDEHHLRYDYGNFYASKTFYDPAKRRRVLWGWANESDTASHDVAKGWAGIQAIPRKVWLDFRGKQVLQWPIEEVEALRYQPGVTLRGKVIEPGKHVEVTGLEQTAQADVEVSFALSSLEGAEPLDPALAHDAERLCGVNGADVRGGVGPFGLWVLASGDMRERTAVFFRVFKAAGKDKPVVLMCTDPTKSSLNPDLYLPTFAGFVDTELSDGKISLRTLIDRSVVESFGAGGKTCILSRVYPSLAIDKDAHLYVFNNGRADVKVSLLTAWEMKKPLMNDALQISETTNHS